MKFLVVDDDPAILKIVSQFIQLKNYEVECCDNALDAIQTLGNLTFDILITDATMPAYSGFDLIRSIRKNPELSYLTITMLTGRSEKSDIERAVKVGVQDYIVKPIDPEVLLQKIEKLAEVHRKKKIQKPVTQSTDAEMLVPIRLTRITDIGVSIESPHPVAKGTIVTIDLPQLQEVGLKQNRFKAILNTEIAGAARVSTEFLLLDIDKKEQDLLAQVAEKWTTRKVAS
ncbi:MAG: response regulator [Pseudomonadota bacterium]